MSTIVTEEERLKALEILEILDSEAEADFDDITKLASEIFNTPISLISLIDKNRQWFKSKTGLEATETPVEWAFCNHAIQKPNSVMLVEDATLDKRFKNNPLVTNEPKIRFYLGAPLLLKNKIPLGTLCVIDQKPRKSNSNEARILKVLAKKVAKLIELRAENIQLRKLIQSTNKIEGVRRSLSKFGRDIYFTLNESMVLVGLEYELAPKDLENIIGKNVLDFVDPQYHEIYKKAVEKCFTSRKNKEIQIEVRHSDHEANFGWYRVTFTKSKNKLDSDNGMLINAVATSLTQYRELSIKNQLLMSRLELAEQTAQIGIWDWNILTGELYWSDILYKLYGLDPDKEQITYEKWVSMIHHDERKLVLNTISKRLTNSGSFEFDYKIIMENGSIKWLSGKGISITDNEGRVVRMTGTGIEITSSKSQQLKLLTQQKIIEHAGIALFELSLKGEILSYNKLAGKLIKNENLIGQNFVKLLPEEDQLNFRHKWLIAVNTNSLQKLIFKNGSKFFDTTIIPISSYSEKQTIGIKLKDITKEIQSEIERLNAFTEGKEEEQKRIASELHDSFGQTMAGLSLHFNICKATIPEADTSAMESLIKQGLKEYREISHNLYPTELNNRSLKEILEESISKINGVNGLKISLEYLPKDMTLSDLEKKEIYRIFQESVQNAMKYSNAKKIVVNVSYKEGVMTLSVNDDGVGFNVSQVLGERSGLGLTNLYNRAALINGKLIINSAPGKGTEVKLSKKLNQANI